MLTKKQQSITATEALPDRATEIVPAEPHAIFGTLLAKAAPEGQAQILFGMGCFWGAERLFWQLEGVTSTSVGYSGGFTVNPTYQTFVPPKPAMLKWCRWSLTQAVPRWMLS